MYLQEPLTRLVSLALVALALALEGGVWSSAIALLLLLLTSWNNASSSQRGVVVALHLCCCITTAFPAA